MQHGRKIVKTRTALAILAMSFAVTLSKESFSAEPIPAELAACAPFLDRELALLPNLRVAVALGHIAWSTLLACALRADPSSVPSPRPKFSHGARARIRLRAAGPLVTLLGCYHPSRQNTNTGRLTREMLDAVIGAI